MLAVAAPPAAARRAIPDRGLTTRPVAGSLVLPAHSGAIGCLYAPPLSPEDAGNLLRATAAD